MFTPLDMLRSLTPEEPELMRLCRIKAWDAVIQRCQSHPYEATPSDLCLGGEGSTALSLAVRSGAPRSVLEVLHMAQGHQIGVTHRQRGSILHDALRYRVSDNDLEFLLHKAIAYEKSSLSSPSGTRKLASSDVALGEVVSGSWHATPSATSSFRHVHIQTSRPVVGGLTLLGAVDDLGRTALHCFTEHIKHCNGGASPLALCWFYALLMAHPESLRVMDADGNTPLILLLTAEPPPPIPTPTTLFWGSSLEEHIACMVDWMVTLDPTCVSISRKLPRPWRFLPSLSPPHHSAMMMHGNSTTVPAYYSPLYYAILYGRSTRTVERLLQALVSHTHHHQHPSPHGAAARIHPYGEVCLHVAVTTRAPPPVLQLLVRAYPPALHAMDVYGLTPMDWLWMSYVLDWQSLQQQQQDLQPIMIPSRTSISRRRQLSMDYVDWHTLASERIPVMPMRQTTNPKSLDEINNHDPVATKMVQELQSRLLHTLQWMLPLAAREMASSSYLDTNLSDSTDDDDDVVDETQFLLHAVCSLPSCSLGMLRLVLHEPAAPSHLCIRDPRTGRTPLHCAAHRLVGYRARLPLGVSRHVHVLQEASPVLKLLPLYPTASRMTDHSGQLPLHVAIDAAKRHRITCNTVTPGGHGGNTINSIDRSNDEWSAIAVAESQVLQVLIAAYPDALEWRDGSSRLFPWQQAAVGPGASVDTIYRLLRWHPVGLHNHPHHNN
jgi:hypothetical protein